MVTKYAQVPVTKMVPAFQPGIIGQTLTPMPTPVPSVIQTAQPVMPQVPDTHH